MNSHKHARLTPKGRALLVDRVLNEGWTVQEASLAAGVSRRTTYKWLRRFEAEGLPGLFDRSSKPHRSPTAIPARKRRRIEQLLAAPRVVRAPEALRALRAVEVLERIGSGDARRVLERIAGGAPEARLTREARSALDRLGKRPAGPVLQNSVH